MTRSPEQRRTDFAWLAVLFCGLAGLVYLPTLRYGFVWDDQMIITENRLLQTSNPLSLFGQTFWPNPSGEGYYRPLVSLSFWVERSLWGLRPLPFHLTNVTLNCLAGALAALLLATLLRDWRRGETGVSRFWPVLAGGLLFAWHPAHVESVAFICGRTDIMMAVFLLVGSLAVLRFRERATALSGVVAVAGFGLALLCKETAVLFPLLALLWLLPAERGGRRPLLILLGAMMLVATGYAVLRTVVVSGGHAEWSGETPLQRVLIFVNSFGRYAFLTAVPFTHRLMSVDAAGFGAFGWPTAVAVVAAAGLAWLLARGRRTAAGLGSAIFLAFVLPGSNIFPIGASYVAERLLYLPVLGAVAIGLGALQSLRSRGIRAALLAAAFLYGGVFLVDTMRRMPIWHDNGTLYSVMAREAPTSPNALYNLGTELDKRGDVAGAIEQYRKAIAVGSNFPQAHNNLGVLLMRTGDMPGAVAEFHLAIAADSGYASAWYNLAGALAKTGDRAGAIRDSRRALELDPQLSEARLSLARALLESGDFTAAVAEFRLGVELDPRNPDMRYGLADALHASGDIAGAIREYRQSIALQPDRVAVHGDLAIALQESGDSEGALAEFRLAVELAPGEPLGHMNLAAMLKRMGRLDAAAAEYRRVLELAPDFEPARAALATLEQMRGAGRK